MSQTIRNQLHADDAECERVTNYLLAKARRYGLPWVCVADRMVMSLDSKQLEALRNVLKDAGFDLRINEYNYGSVLADAVIEARPPTFGRSPSGRKYDDYEDEQKRAEQKRQYRRK